MACQGGAKPGRSSARRDDLRDASQGASRQPARTELVDATRGLTDELAKEVAVHLKAVTNKTRNNRCSDEAITLAPL